MGNSLLAVRAINHKYIVVGGSMDKDKHIGLRIDSETHKKLKSLAEFDGRSMNGEILYLIRQAIAQHEHKHGELK